MPCCSQFFAISPYTRESEVTAGKRRMKSSRKAMPAIAATKKKRKFLRTSSRTPMNIPFFQQKAWKDCPPTFSHQRNGRGDRSAGLTLPRTGFSMKLQKLDETADLL